MHRWLRIVWLGMCLPSALAAAQERPFVFSVTTAARAAAPQVRVDYEVGVGEQALHQQITNGPEQRLGLHAALGRMTVVGHVGMTSDTSYQTSQQGELLVSLFGPSSSPRSLAVGGGILHEATGANVLLARIVAGHEGDTARVHGNVLLQKPLSAERDAMDVITSVGWAMRITPAWAVGVEGLAEDLEGFWDPLEAEGGARILVGPSVHVAPPSKRWQLSFVGGPTLHPAASGRVSKAIRDLPATTSRVGYAARATFACRF
jgi:hypothetical protein